MHIHFLINDIGSTDKLVATEWNKVQQAAGIYFAHAYEKGGFKELAEYVVKSQRERHWNRSAFSRGGTKDIYGI